MASQKEDVITNKHEDLNHEAHGEAHGHGHGHGSKTPSTASSYLLLMALAFHGVKLKNGIIL